MKTTETSNPDMGVTEQGARPRIVCLCGSTRFYDEFQQANYDLTMQGVIVLSVGFYPHAKTQHGHGEGVGHDSAEKTALDELHKRKIDLADTVLVVSDEAGYFGQSTAGEVAHAVKHGKPVLFIHKAAAERAVTAGLLPAGMTPCREPHAVGRRCFDCATDDELAASVPPFPATENNEENR